MINIYICTCYLKQWMLSVKIKKLCISLDNTFFYTRTPTSKRPEKFGDFYLRSKLQPKIHNNALQYLSATSYILTENTLSNLAVHVYK